MVIQDVIATRRNIKFFKPIPVDIQKITKWLETARYAPNHRLNEPWEVLFIGPETRAELNHKTNFGGAPLVLAVLSAPGQTPLQRDENLIAVACFIENFLLQAHAEGIGVGWSSLAAAADKRSILGVPEGYDILGLLPIGYPETVPEMKPRTDIETKIRYLP